MCHDALAFRVTRGKTQTPPSPSWEGGVVFGLTAVLGIVYHVALECGVRVTTEGAGSEFGQVCELL